MAAVAGNADRGAPGGDIAACGPDPGHPVAFAKEPGHLAILDDVDTQLVSRAGKAPGDRIVPRAAAAALDQPALDRPARIAAHIEQRDQPGHFVARHQLGIDVHRDQGIAAFGQPHHVGIAVSEKQRAARGKHHVVVQFVRQRVPQPQRGIEQPLQLRLAIVRAHDRGVSPGVAAADVPFFHHGHAAHTVFLGQIVSRGEAMPAAADDDHVIGPARLCRTPRPAPVAMPADRPPQQRERRIARDGHVMPPSAAASQAVRANRAQARRTAPAPAWKCR